MGRILVADDEQGVREFLSEALEVDGHDVDQAKDGEVAMNMLLASGYDLLITDLKMPRRDGMALLHWLRAEQPDVELEDLGALGPHLGTFIVVIGIVIVAIGAFVWRIEALRKRFGKGAVRRPNESLPLTVRLRP